MVENDIYNSKGRYEKFVENVETFTKKPNCKSNRKYYCKNPVNLKYFKQLFKHFEIKDLSYARRNKILVTMKVIVYVANKDLEECTRDDINEVVLFSNFTYNTPISKKDFIKDMKFIWRTLFPEKDQIGRVDETIVPYVVRHLTKKVDKSQEKLRNDRLTLEEFSMIVRFFDSDPKMQAYIMLAYESLGRPQEILYTKIKDYEFYDNWAKVWISEHGKEGTGMLQCIDSYPYVLRWYNQHPLKDNSNAFFFINMSNNNKYQQWKNKNINKRLKHACKELGIDKNITCYSLKRNGVTHMRTLGYSDMEIQHRARWTSTKQLQIYDMSTQQDALKNELAKRGILAPNAEKKISLEFKTCSFCSYENGFTAEFCVNCQRPLNREKIKKMHKMHNDMMNNKMMQRFSQIEGMMEKMMKMKVS